MNPDITITDSHATRDVVAGTATMTEDKDNLSLFKEISGMGFFETGLLPLEGSGVLSVRQAGRRQQIVFQHAPGIYWIWWGRRERDPEAKGYLLAQPWRIVVGDLVDGQLRGARQFYSPVPISDLQQPLYHCNVPNINCRGYGGTSVGWICLYHTEDYSGLNFGQRVFKITERASGHEAYNDANMSGTDGTRFYQNAGKQSFLWKPQEWEDKSAAEGFEWTLDESLWIPILVAGQDSQNAHDVNGKPLTLDWAMHGNYMAYYPDRIEGEKELSLMNRLHRSDIDDPSSSEVAGFLARAFAKATKTVAPPVKVAAVKKAAKKTDSPLVTKVTKKAAPVKKIAAKKETTVKKSVKE